MYFTNITGGEPFIRTDLIEIVRELYKKSDRIVISTNGYFTDRIVDLAREFPQIGIRISIEGLEETNNEIRGLENGYQRGYQTLKRLVEMGMKDVGFGMTVQDRNAPDLVPLYRLSNEMGMEFATASLHNSFYFVEARNIIHDRPMVAQNFEKLINELLKSWSPKKWFRAYFNHGLINYIYGQERLLPCDMSFDTFFIDPYALPRFPRKCGILNPSPRSCPRLPMTAGGARAITTTRPLKKRPVTPPGNKAPEKKRRGRKFLKIGRAHV